ncbi:hypothetical protein [Fibrella aquatilis]|uniref:Uncharacterized protein n=1 Tax=Fibrella aquatilis TaxID=2817059 RepID=A0A939G400_9BACT|nr:hypothetical protein [Fibrella aquatilis]MBO0930015.1 hypothetical protein [Fibrella aquatilis]
MSYSAYNQPLTLDELRAYQAGQLSAAEQHRIERLLLENPIYADALEGLEAIQQAGSSLQRQTKSLHEALQERIHEAATPRRLMPLWVTSLAASVLLVMSVALYLIYTTNPAITVAQKSGIPAVTHVTQPQLEPGTVLLDVKDLGTAETASAPQKAAFLAVPAKIVAGKNLRRVVARRSPLRSAAEAPTAAAEVVAMSPAPVPVATLPLDPSAPTTLADQQQATRRARTINPERAFSDWPPAVKL